MKEAPNKTKKTDEVGDEIHRILDKTPALHVESREISIRVPDNICTFNAAVRVSRRGTGSKRILFPLSEIENISVHSLGSSKFARLDDSILRVPDGFQLSIKKIPEDVEGVLLTFE